MKKGDLVISSDGHPSISIDFAISVQPCGPRRRRPPPKRHPGEVGGYLECKKWKELGALYTVQPKHKDVIFMTAWETTGGMTPHDGQDHRHEAF